MKCACLKKLIIQDANTTHDIPLDLQGLKHNTTWKCTISPHTPALSFTSDSRICSTHVFVFPYQSYHNEKVLWNTSFWGTLCFTTGWPWIKRWLFFPTPKPSNNSYKHNLLTQAIRNGHFFLIDREPLPKALLVAHEFLFCITIFQAMIVWWQKDNFNHHFWQYFLYLLWKKSSSTFFCLSGRQIVANWSPFG